MTWILHQLKRLQYFLKHGRDDYGKEGFTHLTFGGTPLMLSSSVPSGFLELWTNGGFRRIRIPKSRLELKQILDEHKKLTKKD